MSHTIQQSNWDSVYYDRQSGEFFMMDVTDEGVTLIDAFTGTDFETLNPEEFIDSAEDGDFEEVSERVLRDPAEFAENLLYDAANAVSGDASAVRSHEPVDVDFAITGTDLSYDEDASYRDRL